MKIAPRLKRTTQGTTTLSINRVTPVQIVPRFCLQQEPYVLPTKSCHATHNRVTIMSFLRISNWRHKQQGSWSKIKSSLVWNSHVYKVLRVVEQRTIDVITPKNGQTFTSTNSVYNEVIFEAKNVTKIRNFITVNQGFN